MRPTRDVEGTADAWMIADSRPSLVHTRLYYLEADADAPVAPEWPVVRVNGARVQRALQRDACLDPDNPREFFQLPKRGNVLHV